MGTLYIKKTEKPKFWTIPGIKFFLNKNLKSGEKLITPETIDAKLLFLMP